MKFLKTKELAEKWGIDPSRILRLAREGRIDGARLFGNNWMFPEDAKKPDDRRSTKEPDPFFRLPEYLNFEESDYSPPLSAEETLFRKGQKAFHACRPDDAEAILLPLSENAKSRYLRLSALYYLCYLAILNRHLDFDTVFTALKQELDKPDPYRKEMRLLLYLFEADFACYDTLLQEFSIGPDSVYHPSAFPSLIPLSLLPIENGNFSLLSKLRYDTYELLCQQLARDGYFYQEQVVNRHICFQNY